MGTQACRTASVSSLSLSLSLPLPLTGSSTGVKASGVGRGTAIDVGRGKGEGLGEAASLAFSGVGGASACGASLDSTCVTKRVKIDLYHREKRRTGMRITAEGQEDRGAGGRKASLSSTLVGSGEWFPTHMCVVVC